MKSWILVAAVALACCGPASAPAPDAPEATQAPADASSADAPTALTPANEAARALGEITADDATHLPDSATQTTQTETLTLRGGGGFAVEAVLVGAAEPARLVQGSTLRALMELDVGAAQTLVYRVTRAEGRSLCGQTPATFIVVWDPDGPGPNVVKYLPLAGGAPGEANARACARLDYNRA